jgi:flagellar biosynthesis/type III secretory pathway chaperone
MAFHDLCEALETLLLQHEQMTAFGQQKKEALISNNIDVLNEMVNKEARLVRAIAETENNRVQAADGFLKERGLTSTSSTKVANLIRMITNAEDKLKLIDLADKLSAAVERLRALNDMNMRLTQQSIEFNDFSLDLLTSVYDGQDYVYKRPSDQSQAQHKLKFFDSKA